MDNPHACRNNKQRRPNQKELSKTRGQLLLALFIGYVLGSICPLSIFDVARTTSVDIINRKRQLHGTILKLDDLPDRPTSHLDGRGEAVYKKQLIEPFTLKNLAGISVATLKPLQSIDDHSHATMHEFFYVLQGQGEIIHQGVRYMADPGTFLHVAPGEMHSFVATSKDEPMMFLNVGLTTGPKQPKSDRST